MESGGRGDDGGDDNCVDSVDSKWIVVLNSGVAGK